MRFPHSCANSNNNYRRRRLRRRLPDTTGVVLRRHSGTSPSTAVVAVLSNGERLCVFPFVKARPYLRTRRWCPRRIRFTRHLKRAIKLWFAPFEIGHRELFVKFPPVDLFLGFSSHRDHTANVSPFLSIDCWGPYLPSTLRFFTRSFRRNRGFRLPLGISFVVVLLRTPFSSVYVLLNSIFSLKWFLLF